MNKLDAINNKEEKLIEFIEQNNLEYTVSEYSGSKKIHINLQPDDSYCKNRCSDSAIFVQTRNKDVFKIRTEEILYIAIEDRKSVIYMINKKLETSYPISYWKNTLPPEIFAQPHYSFLVNLNYVDKVTSDFVILKYDNTEYPVYTSSRKINSFKKKLLEFGAK